jgi:hypothetical protein
MYNLNDLNKRRTNFFKTFPKNTIGAEIGVHSGKNAFHIYNIINPEVLYLIDPWETLEEHWSNKK